MQRAIPAILLVFAIAVIVSFPMTWSEFLIDGEVVSRQSGIEMLQGKVDVLEEDTLIKDGAAQGFTVLWGIIIAALLSAAGALSLFSRHTRRFGYMAMPGGGFIIVAVLGATLVTGFPFENGVEVLSNDLNKAVVNAPEWAKAEAKSLIDSMSTKRGMGFWISLGSGIVIAVVGWFYTHKLKVTDAVASLGDDKGPVDLREKYGAAPVAAAAAKDASGDWEYVDEGEEIDEDEWEYE